MDANELRIGNYCYPNQAMQIPCDIREIRKNSVMLTDFLEVDIKSLIPIPLTEELLLKFGFPRIYGSDPQEPNAMLLHYNPTGDFTIMAMENDISTFHYETGITVVSVHQLQNLHFALTGKELEVQL